MSLTMNITKEHVAKVRKRAMTGVALSPQHNQGADLTQWCGTLFNQLQEGSCTDAQTRYFLLWLQHFYGYKNVIEPNVQILYYFSRKLYGDLNRDGGATIEDAFQAAIEYGVWPASTESYDPSTLYTEPTGQPAFKASSQQVLQPTTANMRASMDGGSPVGIAVEVDNTLFSPVNVAGLAGVVDLGTIHPGAGHALFVPKYITHPTHGCLYRAQGSWGEGYGDKGWIWITEAYLQKRLYELGTLDIPKPSQPTPEPGNLNATFAHASVAVGKDNVLTILGAPGTAFTISVTSPALPEVLPIAGTFNAGGQATLTVAWPDAGVYSYRITSGKFGVVVSAKWE